MHAEKKHSLLLKIIHIRGETGHNFCFQSGPAGLTSLSGWMIFQAELAKILQRQANVQ
jgi:hypothetical protein